MDYSLCKEDFWNLNPTYHEKIMWQLKNERDPRWPIYADKLKAKEIAISNNIPVPKLLLKTKDPDSIDFSSLPDMCMFKANHGCGWNCLYYKGRFFFIKKLHRSDNIQSSIKNSKESSKEQFLYFFRNVLKRKYTDWEGGKFKHEWHYEYIDPWVYAENLMFNDDDSLPMEIGISGRYGNTSFLVVNLSDNSVNQTFKIENIFFYIENNGLIEVDNNFRSQGIKIKNNKLIKQLLMDFQILAREFEQVRLDFLLCDKTYYFTEFTFSWNSGYTTEWCLENPQICKIYTDTWPYNK